MMRVIFVRHAARYKPPSDGELTDIGILQAQATGKWIAEQGLRPAHFVHTRTKRTAQTASHILKAAALDSATLLERRGTPRKEGPWFAFLDSLRERLPTNSDVLVVGHHTILPMLHQLHGLSKHINESRYATAAVLELIDGEWKLTVSTEGYEELETPRDSV